MTFLPAPVSGGEEYVGCLQCDVCGRIWMESATTLLEPCVVVCPDCREEKSGQSEKVAQQVTRRVTPVNNNQLNRISNGGHGGPFFPVRQGRLVRGRTSVPVGT